MRSDPAIRFRTGVTLIEVVAALILSATVLAAALVSYGRSVRQRSVSLQRLQAIEIADEMLTGWYDEDGSIPFPDANEPFATGPIEGKEGWSWRISEMPGPPNGVMGREDPFDVLLYRLDIIRDAHGQVPPLIAASVEFVGSVRHTIDRRMTDAR